MSTVLFFSIAGSIAGSMLDISGQGPQKPGKKHFKKNKKEKSRRIYGHLDYV
jgi:hypothetical protein